MDEGRRKSRTHTRILGSHCDYALFLAIFRVCVLRHEFSALSLCRLSQKWIISARAHKNRLNVITISQIAVVACWEITVHAQITCTACVTSE